MERLTLVRIFLFLLCLSSFAHAKECVIEGGTVVVAPDAAQCCPGLVLNTSSKGLFGAAGTCVTKNLGPSCVGSGKQIVIYPGAPLECCAGLVLEPAAKGTEGSRGKCVEKKEGPSCVGSGKQIVIYPGAPLECCAGLVLEPAAKGTEGSRGKCVEEKKECIIEGGTVVVGPNAAQCCPGLSLKPATEGKYGNAGTCEELSGDLSECVFTSSDEITCPDGKVYIYSRRAINTSIRENSKSDLRRNSPDSKSSKGTVSEQ